MAEAQGWDECEELSNKGGGGDFRRLAEHDDYIIAKLIGAPYGREIHWDQAKNQFVGECEKRDGSTSCVHCEDGLGKSKKFWECVFTLGEGNGEAKPKPVNEMEVFECSSRGLKQLLVAKRKYGTDSWVFEIRRDGKKGDTETTYSVMPDAQIEKLDDEIQKAIAEADADPVDLKDLARRLREGGGGDDDDNPMSTASPKGEKRSQAPSGTIDQATAGDLLARLKKIENTEAKRQLVESFGIARVRDLKKADVPKFLQGLAEIEGDDSDDSDDMFS